MKGIDAKAETHDRIKQIVYGLEPGSGRRAAHLANLALATYKDLILHAKSDDLRFQAANALVALPPVQQKLELMRGVIQPPVMDRKTPTRAAALGQRLRRLMDAGAGQASEALKLIEQAEKEAGLTANPREPHPNTLKTNPVP